MSGYGLITLLFFISAALLLANAVPIPATTLPEGSGESQATTEATPTNVTINASSDAMASISSVPEFQCQTNVNYAKSISSLIPGLVRINHYFNAKSRTPICPAEYRKSIRERINMDSSASPSFSLATSVLQAYSLIALEATQHEAVSNADKEEMQVAHELLNGLIQNYFEVISSSHCSCPGSSDTNCVQLRDLSQELTLDSYPSSCSPADYFYDTILGDFQWIYTGYTTSSEVARITSSYQFQLVTCTQWKEKYLASNSTAYTEFTC